MTDALSHTTRLLESLGHQVEEAEVGLGVDWEEFVLASARQWTANLTASVNELAAAFDRPVDSSTLEPPILARYHYGQRVTGAQFVTAMAGAVVASTETVPDRARDCDRPGPRPADRRRLELVCDGTIPAAGGNHGPVLHAAAVTPGADGLATDRDAVPMGLNGSRRPRRCG